MTFELKRRFADLGSGELWEVMWRSTLAPYWLGAGSTLPTRVGSRLLLSDSAGPWRRGSLTRLLWGTSCEALLDPMAGWPLQDGVNTLTISVVDSPECGAEVCITETGPYADPHHDEIERFWSAAIDRLDELLRDVAARRDSPRQAVVVIHGVGEQQPGLTLRALVASGVIAEADAKSFVKPDSFSHSFELRTVTFEANQGRVRPRTDVYELYWAHLIRDTTVAQVVGWMRGILMRWYVPRPLRPAWLLAWIVILAVAAFAGVQFLDLWDPPRWLRAGGLLAAVAVLLWRLVGKGVVINVLGDAARYLSPRPANVAHRQAIREAGVDLIERLHERGTYDRIVILGHSLGSVIAYDILTYAWIANYNVHGRPGKTDFKPLIAVERGILAEQTADSAQALQHAAWKQIRRNTQPWLVTDLVTVGSPLTYAEFLMAPSRGAFAGAQRDGILPTCPPRTQQVGKFRRCTYERGYRSGDGRKLDRTFILFDHSALFGVTRWTNLFFEVKWGGLMGDLVGGPVAPRFGPWVRDVPLRSPVRRFAHTWYWRPAKTRSHLDALSTALGIECGRDLRQLAKEIPVFVIAERVVAQKVP